ncbi:MAG: hypothetical protein LUH21_15680 [Clostridiales bacterium]|nr:hypothetical protein [Clostridiales bacterium]
MRNIFKKVIASTLILGTLTSFPLSVWASEIPKYQIQSVSELSDGEKSVIHEIMTENSFSRGAKPPTGNSFVDLDINDYSYHVEKIGYQVYTNSKFSGVTSMFVSVTDYNVLDTTNSYPRSELTVTLYKDNGSFVDSFKVDYGSTGFKTFTGLSKTQKYYVKFSVPTNSQTYEIKGKIKKGN